MSTPQPDPQPPQPHPTLSTDDRSSLDEPPAYTEEDPHELLPQEPVQPQSTVQPQATVQALERSLQELTDKVARLELERDATASSTVTPGAPSTTIRRAPRIGEAITTSDDDDVGGGELVDLGPIKYAWPVALQKACIIGDLPAVKKLLDEGEDPNGKNGVGFTALHVACDHGHLKVVKLLLERGADRNSKSEKGLTGFHQACLRGKADIVEYFLEAGTDPNILVPVEGWTGLHLAAKNGHKSTVEVLLKYGADRSLISEAGNYPKDFASRNGHKEVAKILKTGWW